MTDADPKCVMENVSAAALWRALVACVDSIDVAIAEALLESPSDLRLVTGAFMRSADMNTLREGLVDGSWAAHVQALKEQAQAFADANATLEQAMAALWCPRAVLTAYCRTLPTDEAHRVMSGLAQLLEWATTTFAVAFTAAREHAHESVERWLEQSVERSSRELHEFIDIAAHDLRAPLRDIDSLAQWIVDDGGVAEPIERHSRRIRQRVETTRSLLDDLVAYARVGLRKHPGERVDIGRLVDELLTDLVVPPGFVLLRRGDAPVISTGRTALRVVLRNLIDNAIKHHDRDRGKIIVDVRAREHTLIFSVADDGPGIPESQQQRVFRMFVQLRSKNQGAGSGVGLALVDKLVHRYGGSIELGTGLGGRGCTFAFTWPMRWIVAGERREQKRASS